MAVPSWQQDPVRTFMDGGWLGGIGEVGGGRGRGWPGEAHLAGGAISVCSI